MQAVYRPEVLQILDKLTLGEGDNELVFSVRLVEAYNLCLVSVIDTA